MKDQTENIENSITMPSQHLYHDNNDDDDGNNVDNVDGYYDNGDNVDYNVYEKH